MVYALRSQFLAIVRNVHFELAKPSIPKVSIPKGEQEL